jgi:uncharacterized damage-inducible protein DinB
MSLVPLFLKEMDREAATTRKMLSRIPDDKYDWKPHEKSMTVRRLATHIAELPSWITMVLTTDSLDFATHRAPPVVIDNTNQLLSYFEKTLADGRAHLEKANEDDLEKEWTMRNGDTVISVSTKADIIRTIFSQIVHHRAQLGVYLRLLNVPIPGSYGPSADEPW